MGKLTQARKCKPIRFADAFGTEYGLQVGEDPRFLTFRLEGADGQELATFRWDKIGVVEGAATASAPPPDISAQSKKSEELPPPPQPDPGADPKRPKVVNGKVIRVRPVCNDPEIAPLCEYEMERTKRAEMTAPYDLTTGAPRWRIEMLHGTRWELAFSSVKEDEVRGYIPDLRYYRLYRGEALVEKDETDE